MAAETWERAIDTHRGVEFVAMHSAFFESSPDDPAAAASSSHPSNPSNPSSSSCRIHTLDTEGEAALCRRDMISGAVHLGLVAVLLRFVDPRGLGRNAGNAHHTPFTPFTPITPIKPINKYTPAPSMSSRGSCL